MIWISWISTRQFVLHLSYQSRFLNMGLHKMKPFNWFFFGFFFYSLSSFYGNVFAFRWIFNAILENLSATLFFCRYSYFHKLLPLLMTGLSDEMPDIQKQARQLMDKVIKMLLIMWQVSVINPFTPSLAACKCLSEKSLMYSLCSRCLEVIHKKRKVHVMETHALHSLLYPLFPSACYTGY